MKEKGITLISLVVTIIILIILAGISINLLLGKNGIIEKAQEAKEKTRESVAMEKIQISIGESYDDEGNFDSEVFKQRIVQKGGSIVAEGKNDIVVEMDGYQATVDKQNGKVKDVVTAEEGIKPIEKVQDENPGELAGSGTEQDPYLIQSIEDLVALSNSVSPIGNEKEEGKEYKTYDGQYIKLETNLDFASRDSYVDADRIDFGDANGDGNQGTLIEEMTTGAGFRPIGKYDYTFNGNIQGNNKEIRNLYINSEQPSSFYGLLGMCKGDSVKVSNLNLINVDITVTGSYSYIGGILGRSESKSITIENCNISGNITNNGSGSYVGGVIGHVKSSDVKNITLLNNTNKCTLSSSSDYTAGMISYIDTDSADSLLIQNNHNKGNITCKGNSAGLIGCISKFGTNITIDSCSNEGNINASSSNVGGIIGYVLNVNRRKQ